MPRLCSCQNGKSKTGAACAALDSFVACHVHIRSSAVTHQFLILPSTLPAELSCDYTVLSRLHENALVQLRGGAEMQYQCFAACFTDGIV